jgi:hypothetical protein
MISRRSFLGGLAAGAIAAPLLTRVADAAALSLVITNQSGRGPLWVYVVGTNLATGQQCHLTANGTLAPVSTSDNGADGYSDYALAVDGSRTLSLPQGISGRMYVALGQKLKFRVNPGNALAHPAGWVTSDPNYPVLHDFVEFTFDGAGMHCNTTMVDMLSVPLALSLSGSSQQTAGRLKGGGRAAVFSALRAQPAFANLVLEDLRVISPGHGIDAGRFDSGYFAGWIDEVWNYYRTRTMTVTAGARTFTGSVQGEQFVFSGGVRAFTKPSTRDVLYCDGSLAAPNDGVTGPVAAALGAGFNRGVLTDSLTQPVANASTYYRRSVTNHYSRVMHENTVDGKAYGFAFDDVGEHAPYVSDPNPSNLTVTLTPW